MLARKILFGRKVGGRRRTVCLLQAAQCLQALFTVFRSD
jgi:hypothetical protein